MKRRLGQSTLAIDFTRVRSKIDDIMDEGQLPLPEFLELVGHVIGRIPELASVETRNRFAPTVPTLRHYQSLGILDPPVECRGRVEFYSFGHLQQVVGIRRLQVAGCTLDQLARLHWLLDLVDLADVAGLSARVWSDWARGDWNRALLSALCHSIPTVEDQPNVYRKQLCELVGSDLAHHSTEEHCRRLRAELRNTCGSWPPDACRFHERAREVTRLTAASLNWSHPVLPVGTDEFGAVEGKIWRVTLAGHGLVRLLNSLGEPPTLEALQRLVDRLGFPHPSLPERSSLSRRKESQAIADAMSMDATIRRLVGSGSGELELTDEPESILLFMNCEAWIRWSWPTMLWLSCCISLSTLRGKMTARDVIRERCVFEFHDMVPLIGQVVVSGITYLRNQLAAAPQEQPVAESPAARCEMDVVPPPPSASTFASAAAAEIRFMQLDPELSNLALLRLLTDCLQDQAQSGEMAA